MKKSCYLVRNITNRFIIFVHITYIKIQKFNKMEAIKKVIHNDSKQLIIKHLTPIDTDYPQYEGDFTSSVPFYKDYDIGAYYIVVQGEARVKWQSHEDYEFYSLEDVSIDVWDDNGKVEASDDLCQLIIDNLQFEVI